MQMAINEFKDQCTKLLHDLPQFGEEIEITDNGKVIAKVLPMQPKEGKIKPAWGSLNGTVAYIADNFDEPLGDEEWEAVQLSSGGFSS